MGPQSPILIIKAPILELQEFRARAPGFAEACWFKFTLALDAMDPTPPYTPNNFKNLCL